MQRKTQKACRFCQSIDKDPFELLSAQSTCQVCAGSGIVKVKEPSRECVFCRGTGVYPNTHLTCTVCNGKGFVTVAEKSVICPSCGGTGAEFESSLPCLQCKGLGVVEIESVKENLI